MVLSHSSGSPARTSTLGSPAATTAPGLRTTAAAVAVWSTNALAAGYALQHEPVAAVLCVMTLGAAATLLAARTWPQLREARRATDRPGSTVPRLHLADLLVGIVGLGGTLVLQYLGLATAPLVQANVISYGWPMFAALGLALTRRDRQSALGLMCALVGFTGVFVMISGQSSGQGHSWLGYTASLASAGCMAYYTLRVPHLRTATVDILLTGAIAAFIASGVTLASTTAAIAWSPALLAALYCGVGPVATGYLLWSRGMSQSASRLAPLGYLIPLLSTVLLVADGADMSRRTAFGAGLIILAAAAVLTTQHDKTTKRSATQTSSTDAKTEMLTSPSRRARPQ